MVEVAVAHRAKLAPKGIARDRQFELVSYPPGQIDKSPAHDTVRRRDRPGLDHLGKSGRCSSFRIDARPGSCIHTARLAILARP